MSNHVTEWLSAYMDGELHGSRFHQVQAHLAECDACLAELDSLEELSTLLQKVTAPEFMPVERFAAQVNLRLPQKKATLSSNKILEIGWWMIPVGLLAVSVLLSAAFFTIDMLSAATNFGMLPDVPAWMNLVTPNIPDWSSLLGQIGVLRGDALAFVNSAETFTRTALPQIILQGSIALLYWSWIAIWWARYKHQGNGQPLES